MSSLRTRSWRRSSGNKPAETPATTPNIPVTPEVPATVQPADLAKYEAEFVSNGKLSDATYTEIQKNNNLTKDQVDSIIAGRQAQATVRANEIFSAVGGEETYSKMVSWAATNMSPAEQQAYNAAVNGGDVNAMRLAVDALEARYTKAYGSEPNLVNSGKGSSGVVGFRSQAEITAAMSDPRYSGPPNKRDPAYIQSVADRIAAS
jgi:hypothetical protein